MTDDQARFCSPTGPGPTTPSSETCSKRPGSGSSAARQTRRPPPTIDALVAEHQPAAILTCWAPVSATAIASAAALQVVARMGVGLDNIAVAAATQRGVLVTNVPDYCVEEVSDHAVGLVLAWTRGLVAADREVRAGRWNPAGARLRRLSNLTCGVVGYGRIGRATAAKLRALGARVVASTPAHRGHRRRAALGSTSSSPPAMS